MGIPDRIILTLYTCLMAVFAVTLIMITMGMIPPDFFRRVIVALPGNWEFAIGGAILFIISVRLLLAGIGVLGGSNSLILDDADSGKTVVSKRALEDYIADIAQEVYGIYGVKVVVEMEDKTTINARIHGSLEPGVNVFEITEEVKDNVRETIKKVVTEIVRRQRDFIEQGTGHLHAMTMQDVAAAIGVHESTVSRAVANKYVALPNGLWPLRKFFTSNLAKQAGGGDFIAPQVKEAIEQLIQAEDKHHPLSDQKLCTMLADKGMALSRRTVMKYREQLGFPSSTKRKRY